MHSGKSATAINVVPFVVLLIAVVAAVIYMVAFKEDEKSGMAEKDALDARQVEQVLENEPGGTSSATDR